MTRNYSSTAVATTLSAACTSVATTISVTATAGFPAAPFILALDAGAAAQELVLVTGVSGLNLTVTRGYDSTTAQAHDTGAVVQHSHAAIDFREARAHEAATVGVHGTSGELMGTSGAQTLTDKTISADSNTIDGLPASSLVVTDAAGKLDGAAAVKAIPSGDVVGTMDTQTLTNKDLTSATNTFPATLALDADLDAHTAAITGVHGVGLGDVVGTSKTQTLTNKNLSHETNTFPQWQAYTPTLTNFGATVDYARYLQFGKTVSVQVRLTITSAPTALMAVSLPVAPRSGLSDGAVSAVIGSVRRASSTDTSRNGGHVAYKSGTTVTFEGIKWGGSENHLSVGWGVDSPQGWVSSNQLSFQAQYEID